MISRNPPQQFLEVKTAPKFEFSSRGLPSRTVGSDPRIRKSCQESCGPLQAVERVIFAKFLFSPFQWTYATRQGLIVPAE
jgi:hypothetical protein